MTEQLSNDTNEIEYNYESYYPRMMCPYFAEGSIPIGAHPFCPVRGMGDMMHQMPHHEALIQTVQNCEVTCEHMITMVREMNVQDLLMPSLNAVPKLVLTVQKNVGNMQCQ